MSPKIPLRRLAATCLAALAAGCATTPPETLAPGASATSAGAVNTHAVHALDLGAKFQMPNRERGRRDRARVNAEYHLELEADEKGPPSAAQIFRAQAQREAIAHATALQPRPKAAGMQPSQ